MYSKRENHDKPRYKQMQLCAQIAESLSMSLLDCGNDAIRDLTVESVLPYPDSGNLMVTVLKSEHDVYTDEETLAALNKASGKLRSDVANSICRKKTPKLRYQIGMNSYP